MFPHSYFAATYFPGVYFAPQGAVLHQRITSTRALQLPIDCVLAGQQIYPSEVGREYSIAPRNEKRTGSVMRSGVRALGQKSTFTTTTNKRGYD